MQCKQQQKRICRDSSNRRNANNIKGASHGSDASDSRGGGHQQSACFSIIKEKTFGKKGECLLNGQKTTHENCLLLNYFNNIGNRCFKVSNHLPPPPPHQWRDYTRFLWGSKLQIELRNVVDDYMSISGLFLLRGPFLEEAIGARNRVETK